MKYKFAHITDLHWCPLRRVPRSRTPEFHTHIKNKWRELKDIIIKHECKEVFISGDIFHLKNPRLYDPQDINYYSSLLESLPVQLYTIPGNHDLPKSSYDLLNNSPYLVLSRATKNVTDISFKVGRIEEVKVNFAGVPYLPLDELTAYLKSHNPFMNSKKGDINVLLIHGDFLPQGGSFFWKTRTYDYILDIAKSTHILLLGHIHLSFPVFTRVKNNIPQMVSKPWSFSRVVKDYYNQTEQDDLRHAPSVAIIQIDTGENNDKCVVTIEYEKIPHVNMKTAFKEKRLVKSIEVSEQMTSFIETLKKEHGVDGSAFEIADPDKILKDANLTQNIRDLINSYLEQDND
jgi:DNA repair exonuclease SbcCD nuclease subunit